MSLFPNVGAPRSGKPVALPPTINWSNGLDYDDFGGSGSSAATTTTTATATTTKFNGTQSAVESPAATIGVKRPRTYSPPPFRDPVSDEISKITEAAIAGSSVFSTRQQQQQQQQQQTYTATTALDEYERLDIAMHRIAELLGEIGTQMHIMKREFGLIKRRK